MKTAWISVYDAENPSDFGGRGYYQPEALKSQNIDVSYIGGLQIPKQYKAVIKLKRLFYQNRFRYKTYDSLMETFVLKNYAQQVSRSLSQLNNIDFVFSGINPFLQPFAYLECSQPIVTWSDAPLVSAVNAYPGMGRHEVAVDCLENALANDKAALQRASLVLYASEWAAQVAISQYQINPSKVKVVPFGPNIPSNYSFEDIQLIVKSRPSSECKLLFIGGEWNRKGGDVAVQVVSELNRSGLKTELTIVGCNPPIDPSLTPYIKCLGYVSNASPEGIKKLQKLLSESHFFILPTRAEAFGYVFCEASSFGVPSLATDVGGIPTIIRDDMNGKKFSKDAKIEEYCTYITDLFTDYSRYQDLALSSFREYEARLNWIVAGQTIKKLLTEIAA